MMQQDLRNKRVTVMGLGRFGGGIAVAKWLAGQGARVLVTDKDPAEKLADSVRQLEGLPIEFWLGEHRVEDFRNAEVVVASPAVPMGNEYLEAARAGGVPVTTEIRLFVERCPARRVLGVTGTKGKSTSTAMLGAMLSRRFRTHVGGNIGRSLLEDLPKIGAEDLVVLELSSFMLEHLRPMRWSPHVGLISMLAEDHIEWHGSVQGYLDAKRVLVEFQGPADFAVLNETCPKSMELACTARGQVRTFGLEGRKHFGIKVPGIHNQLNAQGAYTAAAAVGITWEEAQGAMLEFRPLPHRLEVVHEENGVTYYNDSIATIPEAAIAAINAFPERRVIQIVGGHLKDEVDDLAAALAGRAKAVLGIGEKGPKITAAVRGLVSNGTPVVIDCGDLATAVGKAKGLAREGDIVLLSTGCKSYDQFVNFEQRGDAFAKLARGS